MWNLTIKNTLFKSYDTFVSGTRLRSSEVLKTINTFDSSKQVFFFSNLILIVTISLVDSCPIELRTTCVTTLWFLCQATSWWCVFLFLMQQHVYLDGPASNKDQQCIIAWIGN